MYRDDHSDTFGHGIKPSSASYSANTHPQNTSYSTSVSPIQKPANTEFKPVESKQSSSSKHNETDFLQTMFREHNASLLRFLTRKLANPDDAEDIAQDAYHNLLRKKPTGQLENAKAYLFQTAANLALNRMRKIRRQEHHAQVVIAEADNESGLSTTSPEQVTNAQIELEKVLASIDDLPEKCRRAFLMSRSEHKTYTEISQTLGVSVSTVEKYMITALEHLRHQLSAESPPKKR